MSNSALANPEVAEAETDTPQGREAFVLPASFAQQRLFFLDQLEPGSSIYNVPAAFRIAGVLDAGILESCIAEIVRRHEVLRTTFRLVDGEAVQVISPDAPMSLTVIDLSARPGDERDSEVGRAIDAEAQRPFDLAAGPLLRATLVRLGGSEHVLILNMHHIVTDTWSQEIFMRELVALYEAFQKNEPSPLAELPIQYADFAHWQRETMRGETLERELSYWKQKLTDVAPLELPLSQARPIAPSNHGKAVAVEIPEALAAALKKLCSGEGVTLFMLLLAAWKILLFRYTSQADVSVGTPISNRSRTETEGLVGFFLNTLVLRTDLSGSPTFRQLVARVREVALGAFSHQDLPFETLVEALHPARTAGRNPLCQAMFVLVHGDEKSWSLPGLTFTPMRVEDTGAKFDLTLGLNDIDGKIRGTLIYNTDLFEGPMIARMPEHFRNLLEGIAANPDAQIESLPMLGESEREQLVVGWNQTARPFPADKAVPVIFEERAADLPDAIAIESGAERLSYEKLNKRANQFARHLQALGVARGSCVGVCMERSVELIMSILAILKAGGSYVPLDPHTPAERLAFMLEDSGAALVILRQPFASLFSQGKIRPIDFDATHFETEDVGNLDLKRAGDDVAYVMFTSGSTGKPKGVAVTHRGIARLVVNTDYVELSPDDVVAHASNMAFDAATFEVWGALLNGARLSMVERETLLSPVSFADFLQAQKISVLFLTTPLFNSLAREIPGAFSALRYLVVGGDALDPQATRAVLASKPPQHLVNGYGPTETTTFAICHRVESVAENATAIPIGKPIANTTAHVLDPARNPVPIGVAGEIYIGGPGVARGYVNRPELTAECFVRDPFANDPDAKLYKTGDLARRLADGTIEFLGRLDTQVKVRGFRVELSEIEATLNRHPSVRECAVAACANAGDRSLAAYLVLSKKETVAGEAESSLRQFLKSQLPDYMIPASFVFLEKLPLTSSGKINRRALPSSDSGPRSVARKIVAPRTKTEAKLVRIWEHLLDRRGISVEDNFFETGGHSLMAMRMFVKIREDMGRKLPLSTLFQAPTICELASVIDAPQSAEKRVSTLVALRAGGTEQALFCIHGGDGGTLLYRGLDAHLEKNRPIYALEAPWLIDDQEHGSVAEMAAFYIGQIQSVQPAGPYHLAGYSLGGVVAYEMAQQLRAKGSEVGLLVLFDSYNPQRLPRRLSVAERMEMNRRLAEGMPFSKKIRLLSERAIGKAGAMMKRENGRIRKWIARWQKRANARLSAEQRLAHGRELGERAWVNYSPQPYEGRVLLFVADDPPDGFAYLTDRGWNNLVASLELCRTPGAMHESMLGEPHVGFVARKLSETLNACR